MWITRSWRRQGKAATQFFPYNEKDRLGRMRGPGREKKRGEIIGPYEAFDGRPTIQESSGT